MEYKIDYCGKHGNTKFKGEKQNKAGRLRWRCVACGYSRQLNWIRKTKRRLVEICGGGCKICGYNKCLDALDFHHLDKELKCFELTEHRQSLEKKLEEVKKCVLLCCRCHREVEAGMVFVV